MEDWKAKLYSAYRTPALSGIVAVGHDRKSREIQRRQYLRRYGKFLPRDKLAPILDVGCGTGSFLEAISSIGYSRTEGIDVSPEQVEAARASGLTGITEGAALDYLHARPSRYVLITAFSVLEHLTRPELFELLDAVRDSLRPGGQFIAVVPNAKGLFGAHVRFADITHESSFTPTSVVQICAIAGLEPIMIFEHGPLVSGFVSAIRWTVWQSIRAALLVARIAENADLRWPVFTQDLVFIARKPPLAGVENA